MNWPNWSKVRLIFQREWLDQLRDRRTLFMVAILPLLVYPLVAIGMVQMAQFLKRHPSNVLVVVTEDELTSEERSRLTERLLAGELPLVQFRIRWADRNETQDVQAAASALIQDGSCDLIAVLPTEWIRRTIHEPSQEPDSGQGQSYEPTTALEASPQLFYHAALDRSFVAYQRTSPLLEGWAHGDRKLPDVTSDVATIVVAEKSNSASITATDLSSQRLQRAAIWSKILPFIVFVWALTGAFYPAVDFCAGEKERGTLETLLASAAERLDIVWGKLLATMSFSAATALLNMLCMLVTASFVMRQVSAMAGAAGSDAFTQMTAPPWSALPWIVIALVPIAALFSSLAIALASMARSTKEGQYYLLPLLLVFAPLMMLSVLPTVRLDLGTSLLPVTGIMLCLRHLMEGEYAPVWTYVWPALGVTITCCAIAIHWAVEQFNNEGVLFCSGERIGLLHWLRNWSTARKEIPTAAQALLCGIVILFFRFFAGGAIGFPDSWHAFVKYTVGALITFIAIPALLMTLVFTRNMRKTLLLSRPSIAPILAAIGLAVCLHPFATAFMVTIRECYPIDLKALAPLEQVLASAPNAWSLFLVLALVPAVCEELAFRGFILSGLRRHGTRLALIVSSILFAVAHGALQQSLIAVVFGMILAFIAIQTNCLFTCIAFHATHNALGLFAADWLPRWSATGRYSPWLVHSIAVPGQDAIYIYGIAILLPAIALSALILIWFARRVERNSFLSTDYWTKQNGINSVLLTEPSSTE